MKKLLAILATAAVAAFAAGCDVDADLAGVYSIKDIPVHPSEWILVEADPGIESYWYVDKAIAELDGDVFGRAMYTTYYRFMDGNELVEVPLPHTVYNLQTNVDGRYEWQYTIEAEYSPGNLRLKLATSDFAPFRPDEELFFRLAITR